MIDRKFNKPTPEEIQERKKMYEEADRLGIDLMSFDGNNDSSKRKDVVDAIVLLGTGKEVPADLEKRLLERKVIA